MAGHMYMIANTIAGNSTAGKNGSGTSWPNTRISQLGNSRSAPSSHPTYQSGCAPPDTTCALYGPYSHTGLIWNRPPMKDSTAAMAKNSPIDLNVYVGHNRSPWMLVSVPSG